MVSAGPADRATGRTARETLAAAEQHAAAGLSGTGSECLLRVPPRIYFYRVPERYRGEVESAIRACGKWAG
jgi:hypothetical protein